MELIRSISPPEKLAQSFGPGSAGNEGWWVPSESVVRGWKASQERAADKAVGEEGGGGP